MIGFTDEADHFFHLPPIFGLFFLRAEEQRGEITEENGGTDAGCARGEAAGKDAERTMLRDGFPHPTGERIAEADDRDACPGARPFNERLIDAERTENDSSDNIDGQNARGRQSGFVDQDLTESAERAADQKAFQIGDQGIRTQLTSCASRAMAWQMPGMLSPC